MKYARVYTRIHNCMDAKEITIEVHVSPGAPKTTIVGLPEKIVRESIERVRSAFLNSQFEFPPARITINLAPADLPKEGGCFDLPIAIGILIATCQIKVNNIEEYEFYGELGLTGDIRPIKGVIACAAACEKSGRKMVVPKLCLDEASLVDGVACLPAHHLLNVCGHISGKAFIDEVRGEMVDVSTGGLPDLIDVKGQAMAKRALEIAAAGNHHLLFYGPPGTGKTMLASRLPSLLGPLSKTQALESASIQSLRGFKIEREKFYQPPFRHPHHSASSVALVGGGSVPKPGEISLAHNGILFLDELPEFDRKVLEVLREPIESGMVNIARANHVASFPAKFQLVAAMNPCPCGYYGTKHNVCQCLPAKVSAYQSKISGPLVDRIDLTVKVDAPSLVEMAGMKTGESSAVVAKRVAAARASQIKRQGYLNSALASDDLKTHCAISAKLEKQLLQLADKYKLSARAYNRVLKVSRTIADLSGSDAIQEKHTLEALQMRMLSR